MTQADEPATPTVPKPSSSLVAEIEATLRGEYRTALYVVPGLQDEAALVVVGLWGACATQPAKMCALARDIARGGSPVVLVGGLDVAELAGMIRQEAPGADVRELALPPGSRSVAAMLDYLPGARTRYGEAGADAKCETWLAWAETARAVPSVAAAKARQLAKSRTVDARLRGASLRAPAAQEVSA